jgi:hypothetical protein
MKCLQPGGEAAKSNEADLFDRWDNETLAELKIFAKTVFQKGKI